MRPKLDDETVETLFSECRYDLPRDARDRASDPDRSLPVPMKSLPLEQGRMVFHKTRVANRSGEIDRLFSMIKGSLSSRPQGVELGELVYQPDGRQWTRQIFVAEKLMALLIVAGKVLLVEGDDKWPTKRDEPPRYRLR